MSKISIGFIGAGNMGTAIMKGIASSSLSGDVQLYAFDPDTSKVEALSEYSKLLQRAQQLIRFSYLSQPVSLTNS